MMNISFDDCNYKALLMKAAMVLGDDPTPSRSPVPSNAFGKTPTTEYCL